MIMLLTVEHIDIATLQNDVRGLTLILWLLPRLLTHIYRTNQLKRVMSTHRITKMLISPPPGWVSAQLKYV